MKAGASRLRAAGGSLDRDQRFAAGAAAALIATMFLPWYEKSVVVPGSRSFATDTISAFGAVSFVEAAIFLVAAGVLAIVLTRAEGGRYHLPGGDGTIILVAGLWASTLIFYRVFDRPDVSGDGGTVGIQWGFFVAFVAAGALAVAGERMRAAGRPEPPLRQPRPGRRSAPAPTDWSDESTEVVPASRARTQVVPATEARPPRDRDAATGSPRDQDRPTSSPRDQDGATATPRDRDAATGSPRDQDRPTSSPRDQDGATAAPSDRDAATGSPRDQGGPTSSPRDQGGAAGSPRDRAVRREDAELLELHDPPDAPPLPGDTRRTRDRR